MNNSLRIDAIILGGGQGQRLWPLTQKRAKPAVQIGGKYRLVDVTLSNCLHSNINHIHILTQFNTASLHRHIFQTYKFDIFSAGNIEILAAQQTLDHVDWFQGTADAVRSYWDRFERLPNTHFIILAGDHLYQMDYRDFFQRHLESESDISIAVKPTPAKFASQFGILQLDSEDRITKFVEKPQTSEAIAAVKDPSAKGDQVLASMGIYIFKKDVLGEALKMQGDDFGGDIIPQAIHKCHTTAYRFNGYWEDIGTIGAFFDANIALTKPEPEFSFYNVRHRLFTHPRFLPGSNIKGALIEESLISEGCIIGKAEIKNSIIGIRSIIRDGVRMNRVYQMGADWYDSEMGNGVAPFSGVGENSVLENVILDKNVRVGKNVKLVNRNHVQEADNEFYAIRDGIIVIPKGAIIPDHTVL